MEAETGVMLRWREEATSQGYRQQLGAEGGKEMESSNRACWGNLSQQQQEINTPLKLPKSLICSLYSTCQNFYINTLDWNGKLTHTHGRNLENKASYPNTSSCILSWKFSFLISVCLTCSFTALAYDHPAIPVKRSSPTDQEAHCFYRTPSTLSSDLTKSLFSFIETSSVYKHDLYMTLILKEKQRELILYEVLFSKYKKTTTHQETKCSLTALTCLSL